MAPVYLNIVRGLLLAVVILLSQDVYSQNVKMVDSLLTTLTTTKSDTSHVRIYIALYFQFSRSDPDSAIGYAQQAKALAEELDFAKGLADACYRLGTAYTNLRHFDMAEREFTRSLAVSESLRDTEDIATVYSGLGKVYIERNEFDRAATAYLKALKLLESTNDRNTEARVLNDLGTLYKRQRRNDRALAYYEEALTIVRKLDFQPGISACLMNIGSVLTDLKEYDKALPYLLESLSIKKKIGDKLGECRGLYSIGSVYRELKRYDEAYDKYLESLALAEKIVSLKEINVIQFNLALNESQRGNFTRSLFYCEQSMKQSQLNNDLGMDIKSRNLLAENYAAMGQMDKAYEHSRMIGALKDSLFDERIINISAELDAKYQSDKKQQEINFLNTENQLNTLQLKRSETERNYLIALAILALLLGIVMWSRYRIKLKSNKKLRELDKVKSNFFANISHEFRTPLTLISGCLEDLIGHVDSGEDQMRLAIMQKNTKRLRQLIEQLLDLSKLERGRLELNVAPIDPGSLLRAISSSFSSWAGQKNVLLTVDIPEETVTAYVDEDVLEKVVNNLLSNAIKFSPRNSTVSLTARWGPDEMMIRINDEGPGIPSSKIGQIFDRFYQVDDSNTRRQEGSGIGLALVKELVALHHGAIQVESQPGEGTTFNVKIPNLKKYYPAAETELGKNNVRKKKSENTEHPPTPEYTEFAEHVSDNPIILVVEDNIDLGHYIGDHLPGCSIILAGNGVEGLNKATQSIPDLIISDVMMPEMDGVEFCKNIKEGEKTSHIPVILLTAKADIASRLEGLKTGADDYMTKPFNALELQTRVKNLILQREKLREHFSRTVILKPRSIALTSPDEIFLEKVMSIIENHLGNSEFTVEDFQKEIGMSRMQLHRKLKALTGHSASEFMRIQRLVRASEMLSQGYINISEVCYQTGFSSLSYFDRCFKKQFGVTPKEYVSTHAQIQ